MQNSFDVITVADANWKILYDSPAIERILGFAADERVGHDGFEYIHPDAIETNPTQPNEIGMHRVAFSVDDLDESLKIAATHGCHPLRGVATYGDVYKLTYLRGPSDILVMLAEELNRG